MAFDPAQIPSVVDKLDYTLGLSTAGVQQSVSRYPSSLQEQIVGARFWMISITVCGRSKTADKSLSIWMQSLAGRIFTLPHAALDTKIALTIPYPTQITAAERVGDRQRFTLSQPVGNPAWIGRMIEINGRSVMVSAETSDSFEAYPVVPLPTLPYTLPQHGSFRLRLETGYYPHIMEDAVGINKTTIDCVEVPA